MLQNDRKIVLENGVELLGCGFGAKTEAVGELALSTGMTGYQEALSDPACFGQVVCMTYPLIGNYGLTDEDFETKTPKATGLIVRDYNDAPSNYRFTMTLSQELEENGIPGISGVDTRRVAKMLRDEGSMKVIITDAATTKEEALGRIAAHKPAQDAVAAVSCSRRWYSRTPNYKYNIVALDLGIKHSVVKMLNDRGCNVIVVPFNESAERVMALKPDGLFLSSGPGDPANLKQPLALVRELKGKLPIFGIDLGHQLIAIACGAKTYRMATPHSGGNHPVMNLKTGKVEISAQNHAFAVDRDSLEGTGLKVTHVDLTDQVIEGLEDAENLVFSVQYHPEGAPGPQDGQYLFDKFVKMVEDNIERN